MLPFVSLTLSLQMLLIGLLALITFGQVAFSQGAPQFPERTLPKYVSILTRHRR